MSMNLPATLVWWRKRSKMKIPRMSSVKLNFRNSPSSKTTMTCTQWNYLEIRKFRADTPCWLIANIERTLHATLPIVSALASEYFLSKIDARLNVRCDAMCDVQVSFGISELLQFKCSIHTRNMNYITGIQRLSFLCVLLIYSLRLLSILKQCWA